MLGQANAYHCLARALFDNAAESPDELAFRRGDVLTVLEQNPGGLEGWWLCALRGRQGIAPANRVRLLPSCYERRASQPGKVVTPQKIGGVFLYDVPVGAKQNEGLKVSSPIPRYMVQTTGCYDTPPSAKPVLTEAYDEPRPHGSPIPPLAVYDSPRSNAPISDAEYDTPRPTANICRIVTVDAPPTQSPPTYDGRAFSSSPSGSQSSIETLSSNRSSLEQHPNEVYDIPPEPQPVLRNINFPGQDVYDLVPEPQPVSRNLPYTQDMYDIPTNNMPAAFADMPSKLAPDSVYDIPPQAIRDSSPTPRTDVVDSVVKPAANKVPILVDENITPECSELLLDRESAVELLVKHQHEVQSSISKLFSFVSTTWRKLENMEGKVLEIQNTCYRLQTSLVDLYNFAQGALANSTHAPDKSLCFKLNKLVRPIKESCTTVKLCVQGLDDKGWMAAKLSCSEKPSAPDELDTLVACARNLVEDVRQVTSLIQGNSALLFKSQQAISDKPGKPPIAPKPSLKGKPKPGAKLQERPLPPTPAKNDPSSGEYFNEYDYVNLESKESVERENAAIKAALPKDMSENFDELVKQSEVQVVSHMTEGPSGQLDPKDGQLLVFYGMQVDTYIQHLSNAIDAFLATIRCSQPPKVFVGHSKFIIIGAHKLVYIGDSVHRNLTNPELKSQIAKHADSLCDALRVLVANTRKAAAEFPSVVAVQAMVDAVVDVSLLTNNLKMAIALK